MSWFFNADYESFLFSGEKNYFFNSSKINREFEYFIHFLEEGPIFTTKNYSKDYIKRIQGLSGKEFKTTRDREEAKPWWSPIGELESDRRLHSKVTSAKLGIQKSFVNDVRLIEGKDFEPKEGVVYKMEGELSGRGHLLWPRHREKILSLLNQGAPLIEEPLRQRTKDFSALFLSEKEKVVYQNLVDENFQYKGTRLTPPDLSTDQWKNYEQALDSIRGHYLKLGISFPFSVDSYLYKEGEREALNPLTEVNARKTMGYVALKLKEFFKAPCAAMFLLKREAKILGSEKVLILSPPENQFQTIFLKAKGLDELRDLEESLFSGQL